MSDQQSVETAKQDAAQHAADNHDLGVDGDDPSHADRENDRDADEKHPTPR